MNVAEHRQKVNVGPKVAAAGVRNTPLHYRSPQERLYHLNKERKLRRRLQRRRHGTNIQAIRISDFNRILTKRHGGALTDTTDARCHLRGLPTPPGVASEGRPSKASASRDRKPGAMDVSGRARRPGRAGACKVAALQGGVARQASGADRTGKEPAADHHDRQHGRSLDQREEADAGSGPAAEETQSGWCCTEGRIRTELEDEIGALEGPRHQQGDVLPPTHTTRR